MKKFSKEFLLSYVLGELSSEDRKEIENALSTDEQLKIEVKQLTVLQKSMLNLKVSDFVSAKSERKTFLVPALCSGFFALGIFGGILIQKNFFGFELVIDNSVPSHVQEFEEVATNDNLEKRQSVSGVQYGRPIF